ncbi:MAG: efflux RND transporter periplasmic adaptor subunit [Deltaproteobacteria bacterium]|nr:efflux RND transporter periplasmic adaptor subunit [Deltaproteobacteria bacterium]
MKTGRFVPIAMMVLAACLFPAAASLEEADKHEGHGHAQEKSDLDRPVEEMWKEKCEHNVLQFTCEECRFELGTVKLVPELLGGNGKPGLVATGKTGSRKVAASRTFTGEVKRSEGRTVHVAAPLPGVVRNVFADIGATVAEGAPLFEIDSHDVAESKGDYLKKVAARELAKSSADREATLFERKISAQFEVEEARARLAAAEIEVVNARSRLLRLGVPPAEIGALDPNSPETMSGYLTVRAPRGGGVLERHASRGERVEPGKELFLVSDLSEVWVWADLREHDVPTVFGKTNGGATFDAEVRSSAGGKPYRGTLDVLSGTMNEQSRTVKARVVVPNPDGRLRPGMFVNIRVFLPGGGTVLAVPKAAVLADEGRTFVFVHKEGDYWIRRPVTLGKRLGDMVEIRSGLAAGQRIVTDGSFLLKSDVLRRKMGAGCAD